MAYGHAERTLAAIRRLEAETRELLSGLAQLDPEQSQWLREVTVVKAASKDTGPRAAAEPPLFAGRGFAETILA